LSDRCDGSEQILRDAFEDGSSVICTRCGGLVKSVRWEAHSSTWCPAIQDADSF
jgi:formamidopyrimidine-DNA glycosylase